MKTDLDFRNPDLFGHAAFRSTFNNFENINSTQAWSLLFTAGQNDAALGINPAVGNVFNSLLLAAVGTGILSTIVFHPF